MTGGRAKTAQGQGNTSRTGSRSRYPTRTGSSSNEKTVKVQPGAAGKPEMDSSAVDDQSNSGSSDSVQNQCLTFDTSKMPGPEGSQYEWGQYHASLIETLNHNISIVNNSLNTVSGKANSAYTIASDNQKRINKAETELVHLKKDNVKLLSENAMLKERTIKLESFTKKNNVLFQGIPESEEENCKQLVTDELAKIPELELPESAVVKCFRLGRGDLKESQPRLIKCVLESSDVKTEILKVKTQFSDGIYVSEDFPVEINERRKKLYPIYKRALSIPKYKGKVTMQSDRLVINGKIYTVEPLNNLDTLPQDLHPRSTCEVEDEHTLAYFGMHSPFSNFYPCNFTVDNVQYCCTEQYIQSSKAVEFGDDLAHARIMRSSNPVAMKNIGKRIRKFNKTRWNAITPRVARTAVTSKFLQNPSLTQVLLDTGTKVLAEASPELPWGNGLSFSDVNVLNRELWSNNPGLMGELLADIRNLIRKNKQPSD